MKVTVTFGEITDKGLWMKFCDITGTNSWCKAEGLADNNTQYELTEEQAKSFDLNNIPTERENPGGFHAALFLCSHTH